MSVEKAPEIEKDTIDTALWEVWDMSLEKIWITELWMDLDPKETFVCTRLVESVCMWNEKAKSMILQFDEKTLIPNS